MNTLYNLKKDLFEIKDVEICPIGIRYNPNFIDAYWISRERPFHFHLFDIMTSWAMVVDVYWMEPQKMQPNENGEKFAARVKAQIAKRTGLRDVDWNGYLKHYKPSERIIEEKKKIISDQLNRLYDHWQIYNPNGYSNGIINDHNNNELKTTTNNEKRKSIPNENESNMNNFIENH